MTLLHCVAAKEITVVVPRNSTQEGSANDPYWIPDEEMAPEPCCVDFFRDENSSQYEQFHCHLNPSIEEQKNSQSSHCCKANFKWEAIAPRLNQRENEKTWDQLHRTCNCDQYQEPQLAFRCE